MGTIYVVLILTTALIFTRISSQVRNVNIITACIAAVWHIAQFIFVGNEGDIYEYDQEYPERRRIRFIISAVREMCQID